MRRCSSTEVPTGTAKQPEDPVKRPDPPGSSRPSIEGREAALAGPADGQIAPSVDRGGCDAGCSARAWTSRGAWRESARGGWSRRAQGG